MPKINTERAAELCAKTFTTAEGKELLMFLRERYIDRALPFTVPEPMLRAVEGQRQLVRELEILRDRGLANLGKKPR